VRRAIAQLARAVLALADGEVRGRDLLRRGRSLTSAGMVRRLQELCGEVRTVLDVGANVGQLALACAARFREAEIVAFEPLPRAAAGVRRNAARESRIQILEYALGEASGTLPFYERAYSHVSSPLPINPANTQPNYDPRQVEVIAVEVRRLDEVCRTLALRPPVLLKLDVQGFELQVLDGAGTLLPESVDYVVVECAFTQLYRGQPSFDEVHAALGDRGYELVALVGQQVGRAGCIIEADSLFRRRARA
jgi:FkbM family methyltransferase